MFVCDYIVQTFNFSTNCALLNSATNSYTSLKPQSYASFLRAFFVFQYRSVNDFSYSRIVANCMLSNSMKHFVNNGLHFRCSRLALVSKVCILIYTNNFINSVIMSSFTQIFTISYVILSICHRNIYLRQPLQALRPYQIHSLCI